MARTLVRSKMYSRSSSAVMSVVKFSVILGVVHASTMSAERLHQYHIGHESVTRIKLSDRFSSLFENPTIPEVVIHTETSVPEIGKVVRLWRVL